MVTDCDVSQLKLSASFVDNGGVSTSVPIAAWAYDRDLPTADADQLTLELGNTAPIPRSYTLVITVGPITNPPSYQPLAGFVLTTGEIGRSGSSTVYSAIDIVSTTVLDAPAGGALQTVAPGTFLNDGATTFSSMTLSNYSISATGVIASFKLAPENGLPLNAILWIAFPSTWLLDCSANYSATGTSGCEFTAAEADSQIACE